RILLVVPTYKPEWEIPGGTVEENESPKDACIREISEELGTELRIGNLLTLDYRAEDDNGTELLIFLFDGGVLDESTIARIALPEDELAGFHFVTPQEAQHQLIPALYQLVINGLSQRLNRSTLYTERLTAA
ncbi:MAG: NUDIX hydrolase, partial [Pseudomonadota bacterium]